MKSHKELKEEFDKKVKELKKKCSHKNLSGWSEEWWAMGHPTGFEVKSCEMCWKIIKRRINCMKCETLTEDYVDGDGKNRPMGEYFCKDCDNKKDAKNAKGESK